MIFEKGAMIDGQIEDCDPGMESSRTYERLIKTGRIVGNFASRIIELPVRVNERLLHFVDELDRATGRQ